MAIIHTYPKKLTPQGEDLVLISDETSSPRRQTRSATIESLTSSLGGDKNFVFTQASPSATWTINHGLKKYCSVTVVDSGNNIVIGDIEYLSLNAVRITFSGGFSGKAFLN